MHAKNASLEKYFFSILTDQKTNFSRYENDQFFSILFKTP